MSETYYIREKWHLHFNGSSDTEEHNEKTNNSNKVKSMQDVKRFIKEWLSSWLDYAEDGGHKFLGGETDFKTYASCKIRNESRYIDRFELVVVNSRIKETSIYKYSNKGKFEKTSTVIIPDAN